MNNPCFCFGERSIKLISSVEDLTPFEQCELIHEVEQKSFSSWDDCSEYISARVKEISGEDLVVDDEY
jgi:hypothetical protein